MQAPLAGDAAAPGAKKKVSVLSFMFHEHSLLGLFAPDDHVPPPITPCCCLCVFTDALTRRMRLFVFLVVFALTTTMAVEVQLGIHGSFYQFCFTVLCVTPITCHLKSNLPRYSGWLRDRGVWKLNLLVRTENHRVTGFYEAIGYTEEKRVAFAKRLD